MLDSTQNIYLGANLLSSRRVTGVRSVWLVSKRGSRILDIRDGSLSSATFVAGNAERGLAPSLLPHIACQKTLLQKEGSMGS